MSEGKEGKRVGGMRHTNMSTEFLLSNWQGCKDNHTFNNNNT